MVRVADRSILRASARTVADECGCSWTRRGQMPPAGSTARSSCP